MRAENRDRERGCLNLANHFEDTFFKHHGGVSGEFGDMYDEY